MTMVVRMISYLTVSSDTPRCDVTTHMTINTQLYEVMCGHGNGDPNVMALIFVAWDLF